MCLITRLKAWRSDWAGDVSVCSSLLQTCFAFSWAQQENFPDKGIGNTLPLVCSVLFQHLWWALFMLQFWPKEALNCGSLAKICCAVSQGILVWQQWWDFSSRSLISLWRLVTCWWGVGVWLKGFCTAEEKHTCWALIKDLLVLWLTTFLLMHETFIVC